MNYLKDILIVNAIIWFWVSSSAHTDGNTTFAIISAILGIVCVITILLLSFISSELSNEDEKSNKGNIEGRKDEKNS